MSKHIVDETGLTKLRKKTYKTFAKIVGWDIVFIDSKKLYYSVKEAATILSCSPDTIRRNVEDGKMRNVSAAGKDIRIPREDVYRTEKPKGRFTNIKGRVKR